MHHSALFSFFLAVALMETAAAAAAAAADPLYATPSIVDQANYIEPDYTQCQNSTFNVIGDGEILIADCQAILDDLESSPGFILSLSAWHNSTAFVDHFWTYVTSGSCQFALKRVDGYNNTVYMGNTDLKNLFNESIGLGNGTYVSTVEGVIPCISQTDNLDPFAMIEWSIRQSGNVN